MTGRPPFKREHYSPAAWPLLFRSCPGLEVRAPFLSPPTNLHEFTSLDTPRPDSRSRTSITFSRECECETDCRRGRTECHPRIQIYHSKNARRKKIFSGLPRRNLENCCLPLTDFTHYCEWFFKRIALLADEWNINSGNVFFFVWFGYSKSARETTMLVMLFCDITRRF
jgi:hypothetical protein